MSRKLSLLVLALGILAVFAGSAAAASSPTVSTGAQKSIKQTSAVLLGTVNPNGSSTTYFFQWGLTSAYGLTGHVHSAGSGAKTVNVSSTATGLIPGTAYHYRLVAVSRYGTSVGRDRTFKTTGPPPPVVATGPATAPTSTAVTVTGVINPNGAATGYRFEYGLSTAYGLQTAPAAVASGKAPVIVAARLIGLAPGTIFHYRLVAYHGSTAISDGGDQEFMTVPSPRPKPRVSARTRPGRDRHAPFVFTTSGRVAGPATIPAAFDCNGSVAIRLFNGRSNVSFVLVPLGPNCTYSGQSVLARLPGHGPLGRHVVLRVQVRFRGNAYLRTVGARQQFVIAG